MILTATHQCFFCGKEDVKIIEAGDIQRGLYNRIPDGWFDVRVSRDKHLIFEACSHECIVAAIRNMNLDEY